MEEKLKTVEAFHVEKLSPIDKQLKKIEAELYPEEHYDTQMNILIAIQRELKNSNLLLDQINTDSLNESAKNLHLHNNEQKNKAAAIVSQIGQLEINKKNADALLLKFYERIGKLSGQSKVIDPVGYRYLVNAKYTIEQRINKLKHEEHLIKTAIATEKSTEENYLRTKLQVAYGFVFSNGSDFAEWSIDDLEQEYQKIEQQIKERQESILNSPSYKQLFSLKESIDKFLLVEERESYNLFLEDLSKILSFNLSDDMASNGLEKLLNIEEKIEQVNEQLQAHVTRRDLIETAKKNIERFSEPAVKQYPSFGAHPKAKGLLGGKDREIAELQGFIKISKDLIKEVENRSKGYEGFVEQLKKQDKLIEEHVTNINRIDGELLQIQQELYPEKIQGENLSTIQANVQHIYAELTEKFIGLQKESKQLTPQDPAHQQNVQSIGERVNVLENSLKQIRSDIESKIVKPISELILPQSNNPILEVFSTKQSPQEQYFNVANSQYLLQENAGKLLDDLNELHKKIHEESNDEIKSETQQMKNKLLSLYIWKRDSKLSNELMQLIQPILTGKITPDLRNLKQVYKLVDDKIKEEQESIINSEEFQSLLELNGNVTLGEKESERLGKLIQEYTRVLHFSISEPNAEQQLLTLLNLKENINSEDARLNNLVATKIKEFESFPEVKVKNHQLEFQGYNFSVSYKSHEIDHFVKWLNTNKYNNIKEKFSLPVVDFKVFCKQYDDLVHGSLCTYNDSFENIRKALKEDKSDISWDKELLNLKEKRSLLEGIICINESIRLSAKLEHYCNEQKKIWDTTSSIKTKINEKLTEILENKDSKWMNDASDIIWDIAKKDSSIMLLLEQKEKEGKSEEKMLAELIEEVLSRNLHKPLLTDEELKKILGTDPSESILYDMLKSLDAFESRLLNVRILSNQCKNKLSLSTLQFEESLNDNTNLSASGLVTLKEKITPPVQDIEDLKEIEKQSAEFPKYNDIVDALKMNMGACMSDERIHHLTSDGTHPFLDFLIEQVIRPIYKLCCPNSAPGFFASKAEKSFYEFKQEILGQPLLRGRDNIESEPMSARLE